MPKADSDTKPVLSLIEKLDAYQPPIGVSDSEPSNYEPHTPKLKKRRATTATPTKNKSSKAKTSSDNPALGELSRKGHFFMLVFEAGVAALKKDEVQAEVRVHARQA